MYKLNYPQPYQNRPCHCLSLPLVFPCFIKKCFQAYVFKFVVPKNMPKAHMTILILKDSLDICESC